MFGIIFCDVALCGLLRNLQRSQVNLASPVGGAHQVDHVTQFGNLLLPSTKSTIAALLPVYTL